MSKIIFVNPPLTSYQRYGVLGAALEHLQPVNLCYLAAATCRAGFETEIIDSPLLGKSIEDVTLEIITKSPEYVGITATTCAVFNAGMLAKSIKERNPDIVTILGGVHISALPEKTMSAFKDIDFGVIGEGEETIVRLLYACENRDNVRNIRGIITRDKEELILSGPSNPIDNLDSLSMPAWELLDNFSNYSPNLPGLHRFPVAGLITSRGCSKRCIFCDKSVFGSRIRSHSPKYIIEMIKRLYDSYHIREVIFKDPDFAFSKDRVIKFCRMLKTENLDIAWTCMMRADSVDKELLFEMKDAGCWQVGIGIESGSQKILDFLKKGIKLEKIKTCVNLLREAGLNIMVYFMLGAPFESEDTINQTRRFIKELRVENLKLNFFTPYPGSSIYRDIRNFGDFTEDWSKINGASAVFIPLGLKKDKLQHFSKKILREFYFRPRIVIGYLPRLRNLRTIKRFFIGMLVLIKYILKRK